MADAKKKRPADGTRPADETDVPGHCLTNLPYRAIVYVRSNQRTPLYQVAGSGRGALGARNALLEAVRVHGGACFYCLAKVARDDVTLDHVDPRSNGGREELHNLVLACSGCNRDKANKPIERFDPAAGGEWLGAMLKQLQQRLRGLPPIRASEPRPPAPASAAGP